MGDGATVNGTQRSSKTLSAPQRGANLAYAFAENSSFAWPICWCSSHRIDLCAKKLEDQQNVQSILRMVRRLSSHIASSTAAQGHMKALTKVITEDSEKANRSTSGFSYAPPRFVSHAAGGWQDSRWFLLCQRVQPGPTRRSSSNVPHTSAECSH